MEDLRTRNRRGTLLAQVVRNRPRSPGITYAVLTVALTVLVGALALTSRQSAPPTIAEFAPQAAEQITGSSGDSAATRGSASGETSMPDEQAGTNDATEQTIDVARVRRCVGDPPRQIEDPQSPPCVPYWSGDNGGATWRGVSRDEIRVTDPYYSADVSPALMAFFNRRFELYGRHIRLMPRSIPGEGDSAGQRAAARAAYEEDRPFASTTFGYGWGYFDELARLGIIGVHPLPVFPETYLAAHRPYLWLYPMANDREFAMLGDWYCARFAGRNANHAGDPLLRVTQRKPGIILDDTDQEGTSAEPMNGRLASCGERTDAVVQSSGRDLAYAAAFMHNSILKMKTSGVTTVACLCNVGLMGLGMRVATQQGYFPEWVITDYIANTALNVRTSPQEQSKSLMLLPVVPMERPHADHPSNWAMQETSNAGHPASPYHQFARDNRYRLLLLLASGFQMAGPNLTPETFERGLHQARFPNPAHRIMAGAVGFGDGDHTMTDDAVEAWWSSTTRDSLGDPGTFCYVDHGARRRLGTFPTDDPFFKGECDNGTS